MVPCLYDEDPRGALEKRNRAFAVDINKDPG